MKRRADSLFSKLTPEQREDLLVLCVEQSSSLADGLKLLSSWGLSSSPAALSRLISLHGMSWRIDRAKEAAAQRHASLPKDWEEKRRQGLAQKEFELTFRDLSAKEWALLKSLDIEERKLELKSKEVTISRERLELVTCEKFLLWVKDSKAREIAEGSLSNAEKIARLRKRFFADVDAMEASGDVQLPE